MSTDTQSPTVESLVREQHEEIRQLFRTIEGARGDDRAEAFRCLVRLLAVHETAEEEIVHPAVRRLGGEAVVDQRLEEEASAKELLSKVEKIGTEESEFDRLFADLMHAVEAHANAEEAQELPLLASDHDAGERERMAARFQRAESMAPTHPHPHGPESQVGNLLVGPFAAVADRVRDAVKGDH